MLGVTATIAGLRSLKASLIRRFGIDITNGAV